MKKLILFLLFFLPLVTLGQSESPYKYLKLEDNELIFERIYTLDSTSAQSIEQLLLQSVPTAKDITTFNKSPEVITAKIENSLVDYRKYGGKGMSTITYMNFPFSAGVSIVWKDNRYKVTVSNMLFNTSLGKITGTESFTKSRGQQFDMSKIVVRSGAYLEKYLSDLFLVKNNKKSDW